MKVMSNKFCYFFLKRLLSEAQLSLILLLKIAYIRIFLFRHQIKILKFDFQFLEFNPTMSSPLLHKSAILGREPAY